MNKSSLLAMMLILGATSVPASAQDEPEAQAKAEKEKKKEKKICRTEKVTGSLTRVNRICMTRAEWDELERRTKRGIDDTTRGASGGHVCTPNPADPFGGC